jgi:pimeloyl-ACP methyl ester carboxylesterase
MSEQPRALHHVEKGSGYPLVLLHGFPLDSRVWQNQLDGLSDRYRVVCPDLQGFGKSASTQPFSIDDQAEAVHAHLQQIGALPCALGGLSMGGYVALAFAQKYPEQIDGLILVDTKAAGDTPDAKAGRMKMIDLVKKQGAPAVADQMMPRMVAENSIITQPQTVDLLRQIIEACPPRTIENALLAMRDRPDRTDLLPSIADPVLILVGESDAITPVEAAQQMKDGIPHAVLTVIPDAGHMSPMENPKAVNAAIRRFMDELPR